MPGANTNYQYAWPRTRRLSLVVPFRFEGMYYYGPPWIPRFMAVGGVTVIWAGFELWMGGRTTDVCASDTGGAFSHGYQIYNEPPFDRSATHPVFIVQVLKPDSNWVDDVTFPYAGGVPCAGYREFSKDDGVKVVTGQVELWVDAAHYDDVWIDTRTPRSAPAYKVQPPSGEANPPNQDHIGKCVCNYGEGAYDGGSFGWAVSIAGGSGSTGDGVHPGPFGMDALIHRPTLKLFAESRIAEGPTEPPGMNGGDRTQRLYTVSLEGGGVVSTLDFGHMGSSSYSVSGNLLATCTGTEDGNLTLFHKQAVVNDGNRHLVTANCEPKRVIAFDGLVTRAFEANYGKNVVLRAREFETAITKNAANGIFGNVEAQRWTDMAWEVCVGGIVTTLGLNGVRRRMDAIRLILQNQWLLDEKEDVNDWRVMLAHYQSFTPWTLLHKLAEVVDDCNGSSGWTPTNCTLGGTTTLTVTPTGSPASCTKSYTKTSTEHRYLRIRAKASTSGKTLTIQVQTTNKTWTWTRDLAPAGTWSDIDLDLCAPPGETALSDLTDSSWIEPGPYYGPRQIVQITLSGFAVGTSYEVDYIHLVRLGDAMFTGLQPFDEKVIGADGHGRYRACWGLVDGRQVLDFPYRRRLNDLDANDYFLTVSQLKALLQASGGYTLADTSPPDSSGLSGFLWGDREACWFASEHYPGGVRTSLLDVDMESAASPKFLVAFDEIRVYPGMGDPAASYSNTIPVRFTKRLQPVVHGLTADPARERAASGQPVYLKLGGVTEDTDGSDSDGHFRHRPFKWRRQSGNHWTVGTENSGDVDISSTSGLQAKLTNRKFRWAGVITEEAQPEGMGCVECDSARGFIHIGEGARIVTRLQPSGEGAFGSGNYSVDGFRRLRCDVRQGALYLLGVDGTDFVILRGHDGGTTSVEVLRVTASSALVEIDSERGMIIALYEDGAGKVWRRISTDLGATWASAEAVTFGGSQMEAELIDSDCERRSGSILMVARIGGGVTYLSSRDMGKSFVEMLS